MLVRKAFQYRLYPNASQAAKLEWTLDRCRELYNAALQERRDAYRMAGVSVGYYAQKRELPGVKEVRPEYKQIGSQVLQDVVRRLDRAFAGFFRRVKNGEMPGYPRFKGKSRYNSFAGWAQFLALLRHKAADAGVVVVAVNPSGTSQLCSGCGAASPKTLADRWHRCAACGLSIDRDHNAARNILHRAGLARAVA